MRAKLRVSVVDGKANVELLAGDGATLDSADPTTNFQTLDEGESLTVGVSIARLSAKVTHPDLDFYAENGLIDKSKLRVELSPARLEFAMERDTLEPAP